MLNDNNFAFNGAFAVGAECTYMPYGERLKATRVLRGFTQNELAEKVGVSESTIRKLEKDSRLTKSHFKIASVLQCDPSWLYSGEKPSIDSTELNYSAPELDVGQVCRLMEDEHASALSLNYDNINRASYSPLSNRAFSVRVTSPVNSPALNMSDVVFIDPEAEVVSGALVALLVQSHSGVELVIRRLFTESGCVFMEPDDKVRYGTLCQEVRLVDSIDELLGITSDRALVVGVATEKSSPLFY